MSGTAHDFGQGEGLPVVPAPAEVDVTNADELGQAVRACADAGHAVVVVDMRHTTFCDSAAVNVLLQEHKRLAAAGGGLHFVATAASVLRLFDILGVDRLVPTFSSLDEAVAESPARRRSA
jgi:anti-anti-sigma factor